MYRVNLMLGLAKRLEHVEKQEKKLELVRDKVRQDIIVAQENDRKIEAQVFSWVENAENITKEAKKVIDDGRLLLSVSGYHNCRDRYRLGKQAKKMAESVANLISKSPILFMPSSVLEFESQMQTLEKIMDAVADPIINVIGVYGMPGIGKTTMVQLVAKIACEKRLFDAVPIASALDQIKPSHDEPTQIQKQMVESIQHQLAMRVGLEFVKEWNTRERAQQLRQRLKKEKRVLVILDHMWNPETSLMDIGIPSAYDHRGCVVLITSRRKDVLSEMGTQRDFLLEPLQAEEGLHLFKEIVGFYHGYAYNWSFYNYAYSQLAIEIAKECKGLPRALVEVAIQLRNDEELEKWKAMLEQLRTRSMFPSLIFSSIGNYDLKSGIIDNFNFEILSDCSLLGTQISYQKLHKYWAMNIERVYERIDFLKRLCLLQNGETSDSVTMHDVVYDFAITNGVSNRSTFVVKHDVERDTWPDEDTMKNFTHISLLSTHIPAFPQMWNMPKLRFLHVSHEKRSSRIPETFFQGIKGLEILDLTKMELSPLPPSLVHLTNIQTLCLDQCVLGHDIAMIGDLKSLKVLSLSQTNIEQFPSKIGQLTYLQLLDLSHCPKLHAIELGVLSNLVNLKELLMENSLNVKWAIHGEESSNASLGELSQLHHLTNLEINISDPVVLPTTLSLPDTLIRYKISIGQRGWHWLRKASTMTMPQRILELNVNAVVGMSYLMPWIKVLLEKSEALWLGDQITRIKDVVNYRLEKKGFRELKHLHVQDNSEIECIINYTSMQPTVPVLQSLVLNNLINLTRICSNQFSALSLCELKVIRVEYCHMLQFLLSISMAIRLSQLIEVEVTKCSNMEAIVDAAEVKQVNAALPKLEYLKFADLPRFRSIGDVKFKLLKRLIVSNCNNLTYVISQQNAASLERMEKIEVSDCAELWEVIQMGEIKADGDNNITCIFPRLRSLKLINLPKLARICSGISSHEFPLVKELSVGGCPRMKSGLLSFLYE